VKAIILVLNCYILFLSLLGCKDKEEFAMAPSSTASISLHSPGTLEQEDDCPPFCTCACCGVNKTVPSFELQTQPVNSVIPKRFSLYHISFPKEISLSIWQPPKLSLS